MQVAVVGGRGATRIDGDDTGAAFAGALQYLAQLQERLASIRYRLRALVANPTVSIGFVTLHPGSIITAREVRETASHALLDAKHGGRNRIEGFDAHAEWNPLMPRSTELEVGLRSLHPRVASSTASPR